MSNGTDSKYRSRKWRIAVGSLVMVSVFAFASLLALAIGGALDASGAALIIGAWAASDTTIIGVYSTANVVEKRNGS
jgi:hypothetical protein